MGSRVSDCLSKTDHDLFFCEKSPERIEMMKEKGYKVTDIKDAVPKSDYIIMAVSDLLLGSVSKDVVPIMASGATFILLDPAAAYIKDIELRDDCSFIVAHPCHPSFLTEFTTPEERADKIGGVAAKQDIVVALIHGKEGISQEAAEICKQMFAPVENAFIITLEQMIILEPILVEVVVYTLISLMKNAMDKGIELGVPEKAAHSFVYGHINEILPSVFVSDTSTEACKRAVEFGMEKIIKNSWEEIFEKKSLHDVVDRMIHPDKK